MITKTSIKGGIMGVFHIFINIKSYTMSVVLLTWQANYKRRGEGSFIPHDTLLA